MLYIHNYMYIYIYYIIIINLFYAYIYIYIYNYRCIMYIFSKDDICICHIFICYFCIHVNICFC